MCLRIEICRDAGGTWSVHGPSPVPASDLPSLSASIDYARQACNAAPATIELYVDGMYIVAHQERGWPKALVTSQTGTSEIGRRRPLPPRPDPGGAALMEPADRLAERTAALEYCSQPREPQASLIQFRQLGLRPPG